MKIKNLKINDISKVGYYINPDHLAGILPIIPGGTNSTMFTECCHAAICSDEPCCPSCNRDVIGHDADPGQRDKIRWKYAYQG